MGTRDPNLAKENLRGSGAQAKCRRKGRSAALEAAVEAAEAGPLLWGQKSRFWELGFELLGFGGSQVVAGAEFSFGMRLGEVIESLGHTMPHISSCACETDWSVQKSLCVPCFWPGFENPTGEVPPTTCLLARGSRQLVPELPEA